MKLILTADLHGSSKTTRKLATFKQLLRDLTQLAVTYGTYRVCVLGDIYDARYGTPPEVVLAVHDELVYAHQRGVYWMLLPGNHDVASHVDMSKTLLRVYSKQAYVFDKPTTIELDNGGCLCIAPWRPIPELRRDLLELSRKAVKYIGGPRILFTHTPLKEGAVSRSNFTVRDLDISVQDMYPDAYDAIYIGDYHGAQMVGPNARYLGSPIQHGFGDGPSGGAYLLDLTGKTQVLQQMALPSWYPSYRIWDITGATVPDDLYIPDYNADDYNWIRVPFEMEGTAAKMYPTARIEGVSTRATERKLGRLGNVDPSKVDEVMLEFCKVRGWGDQQFALGMGIVREAAGL